MVLFPKGSSHLIDGQGFDQRTSSQPSDSIVVQDQRPQRLSQVEIEYH